MKNKSEIPEWPRDEETLRPDYFWGTPYDPIHREYFYEGDEFLDDAIRTVDQTYEEVDGTLEMSKIRSRASDKA